LQNPRSRGFFVQNDLLFVAPARAAPARLHSLDVDDVRPQALLCSWV